MQSIFRPVASGNRKRNWFSQFRNLKTAGGMPPATPIKTLRHSSPPFRAGYSGAVFIKDRFGFALIADGKIPAS